MAWNDPRLKRNNLDEVSMGSIRPNAPQENLPPEFDSNLANAGLTSGFGGVMVVGKKPERPSLYKALGRKK